MNPHGCPPDPKSGASAIPPLSHTTGGSVYENLQYIHIFPLGKPKRPPGETPLPCFPEGGTAHCGLSTPPDSDVGSCGLPGTREPGSRSGICRVDANCIRGPVAFSLVRGKYSYILWISEKWPAIDVREWRNGRRAGFRIRWATVRVQIPPLAPTYRELERKARESETR